MADVLYQKRYAVRIARTLFAPSRCQRRRPELLAAPRVHKQKFNHRMFCVVFVVLLHQASWC